MPHSKGYRSKTRRLLSRRSRSAKGLSSLLTNYSINDKVVINIDRTQIKGMPHRRFQGRVGSVVEVRRRSLVVNIPVGGKTKKVVARIEHVKPHKEVSKVDA